MSSRPRDYTTADEIHMESGELHEPTNTVPPLPSGLESALAGVARRDASALGGSAYAIAMRRIIREDDRRFLRD